MSAVGAGQSTNFSGRFVILTHDHPFVHWDLMLERDGVLKTWRLLSEPGPASIIAVEPLPDHRLAYLDYEGPVSRGRGQVERWDSGTHQTNQTADEWLCALTSRRLGRGTIRLSLGPEQGTAAFRFDAFA